MAVMVSVFFCLVFYFISALGKYISIIWMYNQKDLLKVIRVRKTAAL